MGKGFSKYGVAGLMGNLRAESALEPKNLQNSYEKKLGYTNDTYTSAVDSGKYKNFVNDKAGYGLAQWTYWSRKQNLLKFARSAGKSIGDLEMQLDFLYQELSTNYKSVFNVLKTATSVKQASNSVLLDFEKPANQSISVQNKRAEYGQTYFDKFANESSTSEKGGTVMTEMEIREKVVSIARKYLGCKESDGSHRKIIDGYNAVTPRARGYKVTYKDAWCATFVSFVGIEAGLTDIMFRECGCGAMIQLYQNAGRWVENDAYTPKIGDIIMYDWDDKGNGNCTGYPEHVGIVASISGSKMKVIEGNISDSVGYRDIAVNARYIRGYAIPNYASKATSSAPATSKPTTSQPTTSQPTTSTSDKLNRTVQWTGYVTADSLNVRPWAGTENTTLSFSPLKEGVEVGVCDSVKDGKGVIWYYIKYSGKYGFVSSKYIQKKDIVSNQTSASSVGKVDYAQSYAGIIAGKYRTTANLNLRLGAGTSKKSICVIKKGEEVSCYGYYTALNGTKWYFVTYKTYTGFVSSKYLKK